MTAPALVVIAKAPMAGRSKTRLCPPCTPEEAAWLAEAALRDTLAAALATPARRRVLVLEGAPGDWLPRGFEVIRQRGGGLAERLAAAFDDVGGPAFLIGMDTPQVTPRLLATGLEVVARGSAAFGSAPDGGYWAIGLPHPDPGVFAGVPMSAAGTGRIQRRRLRRLGFPITDLPALRDVDTIDDARAAAAAAPHSGFANALHAIDRIAA
jgi:glycosyltransferase A (GT-A) superfamily protein (DUF2064 family)